MYLKEMNLWNFRKYEELKVNFKQGLNVLIGENDSGKTTIVDAIKLVLGTNSNDFIKVFEDDFHKDEKKLKIELIFSGLSVDEGAKFIEWLTIKKVTKPLEDTENPDRKEQNILQLKLRFTAEKIGYKIKTTLRAGEEETDKEFSYDARELLRVTYLKPLRDAENELKASYNSRLAYILKAHSSFQKGNEAHRLETVMKRANKLIDGYFLKNPDGTKVKSNIDETMNAFLSVVNSVDTKINISDSDLNSILKKLNISLYDTKSGLGTLNLLFMATELLLLSDKSEENKLCLIEEIEAHLHPQAQLRVIKYFESILQEKKNIQIILTTHSINLASSISLESLILCKDNNTYPLGYEYTHLSTGDYQFLERFLDATKSNMFFAKGIIMVEGDAENLLIPTIAEIIERPLYKFGVSIVNVGSTALFRYANIFLRKREEKINIPVSVLTDLDVFPYHYYLDNKEKFIGYSLSDSVNLPEYDIENLVKNSYKTQKEFLKEFLKINDLSDFSKARGLKSILLSNLVEKFEEVTDELITEKEIAESRVEKRNSLSLKYTKQNNIVFAPEKWTLEYDIALSCLRKMLYASIMIAKNIDNKSVDFKNIAEESTKEIETWEKEGKSAEEIAFLIYKPLLKKQASKAITAQWLSRILSKNMTDKLKSNILNDPYLEYLIKAINHVTDFKEGNIDETN